jgi:hypothetical protein
VARLAVKSKTLGPKSSSSLLLDIAKAADTAPRRPKYASTTDSYVPRSVSILHGSLPLSVIRAALQKS